MVPATMMLTAFLLLGLPPAAGRDPWKVFGRCSAAALLGALASLLLQIGTPAPNPPAIDPFGLLAASRPGAWMALLVQFLGTVIGMFSARYLQGEAGQRRYAAALSAVLAAVQLLLLAGHWLVLIGAWSVAGAALQRLLCFYDDRPFALLAAHKKRIADRLADLLLMTAALLCWKETGSGSFAALWQHLPQAGDTAALQAGAVCLVLAVILRTALLPLHGWLIQVMEAPTPVSALLHAGVVNLGGYVLIRFAPLLEQAPAARWLAIAFGLATALLAGLVTLTRVSIKVRLAWSTVAQMGFMALECGLGLYSLAMLHLIGHSLYKAHAFLAASSAVRDARQRMMHDAFAPSVANLAAAPLAAGAVVATVQALLAASWPWWWSGVLALAWAPLLWLPARGGAAGLRVGAAGAAGAAMAAALSLAACIAHALPFGIVDSPDNRAGIFAFAGMALMYLCLATLRHRPQGLAAWRRWSYAGFYVDEFFTRFALRLWPARWAPGAGRAQPAPGALSALASSR
jgi:NAD(P)H-quinone oxidoreductase subunit 5